MGDVSPETCWAIKKQLINKFYYTVAFCWFFLWDLYYDARIHEYQVSSITFFLIKIIFENNLKERTRKDYDMSFRQINVMTIRQKW